MTVYVYDKRVGKIVEKRSRDDIKLMPFPTTSAFWADYLEMMDDIHDILAGREPRQRTRDTAGDTT